MSKKLDIQILGPSTGYTDLVDAALLEESQAEAAAPRKYNPLRPSAAGECARKLAYQLAEYRLGWKYDGEIITPNTKRIFSLGHSIERNIIYDFKKLKGFQVLYCQQTIHSFEIKRAESAERLKGALDWCLFSPEHRAVFDAKSRKDKYHAVLGRRRDGTPFARVVSGWDTEIARLKKLPCVNVISDTAVWINDVAAFIQQSDDDTLIKNVKQLMVYLTSDFAKVEGITHASIIRYNKNTSSQFEIRFGPSDVVLAALNQKFDAVSAAIDNERPEDVPQEYETGSFQCGWCPYAKYCKPGINVRQAFFNKKDAS